MKGQTNAQIMITRLDVDLVASTGNNSDLIGAKISVGYNGKMTHYVWNGNTVSISLPMQVECKITVDRVEGYTSPDDVFVNTAEYNYKQITFTYRSIFDPIVANAIDLSKQNLFGEPISTTTANCYVVRMEGTYAFPLVYGNALKNGVNNTNAYTKVYDNDTSFAFVNHLDNAITSPFIEKNEGCYINYPELVMADAEDVFSNIRIVNGSSCKYVQFEIKHIPSDGANGIISVKDLDGKIAWSWHIWVWQDDLTPITVTNLTNKTYNILPVNLAAKKDKETNRVLYNWYYQWGRPMPMLGAKKDAGYNNVYFDNYGSEVFTITNSKAATYGESIQNPTTMYGYGDNTYHNWFGDFYYYNLWDANCRYAGQSDNVVVKTIYDPSPIGFTMPNGRAFSRFNSSNLIGDFDKGYTFKRNEEDSLGIFIPASGCLSSYGISDLMSYSNLHLSSTDDSKYINKHSFNRGAVGGYITFERRYTACSVRPVLEQ